MKDKNVVVVGSSHVLFTYSYIKSIQEVYNLTGFIDIGVNLIDKPMQLSEIPTFDYGIKSKKYQFPIVKRALKLLNLDRTKFLGQVVSILRKKRRSNKEGLSEFLIESKPDVIFYLWSTTADGIKLEIDKNLAGKIMPNQVLVVNTYPVNSNINWNDFNENLTKDAEYFKGFDRVFVPSSLMSTYFHNKLNLPVNKIYIQQDKLHKSLFVEKSEPILSENEKPPRVIFLGNSNFSLRTIDDVRSILRKIANQGVEVYIQDGGDKVECENIKYYTPFTYQEMLAGKLSQYIQGFDAVLVIYNDLENLRANISYPTRFAMATLGIDVPIIIKKGQFKAIDEIYSKTNRLLHYESEKELINICKNKSKLSLLRSEIRLKKNSQLDLMTKDEITKMLMCCDVD